MFELSLVKPARFLVMASSVISMPMSVAAQGDGKPTVALFVGSWTDTGTYTQKDGSSMALEGKTHCVAIASGQGAVCHGTSHPSGKPDKARPWMIVLDQNAKGKVNAWSLGAGQNNPTELSGTWAAANKTLQLTNKTHRYTYAFGTDGKLNFTMEDIAKNSRIVSFTKTPKK